ncbi:response regulator transcription factor [Olivibacter domesticus]|uniref:Two component transcriptional regulator, LuxR family n=1 Tax=Olivibacter domesticus TaxID=407022 RepID=A0A1H7YWI1_OLID1|nr:response regulator transcription factor [Olivibacter domesticus]SEM50301.1 two component transcriptional regulator, LuxR family [Olivibacter domesticus]
MKGTIGIVDDQQLFLKTVGMFVDTFPDFQVVLYATDGQDLLTRLRAIKSPPDILLIDVNMPFMEGAELVAKIKEAYPSIKMAALSMMDDSQNVIKMIKAGCCAYLLKNMNPNDLEVALKEIMVRGYYNTHVTNIVYHELFSKQPIDLKDREREFLELACSDLTYQQIADKMFLSIKTVDGYRAALFEKFQVKSRVGLVLEAIRQNLISV